MVFVSLILLCVLIPVLYGHVCTTEVTTLDDRIVTFVDCNTVFEVCCNQGCCPRFSHAHIWLFTAGITFIICICVFGCWLLCCKNARRDRVIPPRNDDRVDSPLTFVAGDSRNDVVRAGNQNNAVPTTPPPTYEEATAMR